MMEIFTRHKLLLLSSLIIAGLCIYALYPEAPLPGGVVVDRLHVVKSRHIMEAYAGDRLLKTYKISIGRGAWGMHDGEPNLTPVGNFTVSKQQASTFHKALPISYGNLIEIHGMKNHLGFIGKFHRWIDWTRGCIALTNTEIDELYVAIKPGATITIEE